MRVTAIALLILGVFAGCGKAEKAKESQVVQSVNDIFEAELKKRNLEFSGPDSEKLYKIKVGEIEVTACLENIARNYRRDGDPDAIVRFVDQILKASVLPAWDQAKSLLFFSAEPATQQFDDTIRWSVSDSMCKVLVLTDLNEGRITWILPSMLKEWGVTKEQAVEAATANMDRLLEGKKPETNEIDGMKLGMVPVGSVFKASVIFAPGFKRFASEKVGWPVLAVIPCRDFIYIIAEKDKALLNRMGDVVRKEYKQSGYPITTEVLRVSDEGVKAIGKFEQ